ncbi:MAG TPA: hypothetical protein VD978_28585 [Azospirillum sp.]|nr:hypothetical protein [Azospirillum sp.]
MLVRVVARVTFLTALLAATATGSAMAETAAVGRPGTPSLPDAAVFQTVSDGTAVLRIDGIITKGAEQRFSDIMRALPRSLPVVIELSSPGGFTSAGYRMIDLVLAERGNGRPVATRVRGGESCESMCVGVFLAGYPRYAAPSAEFMVHAPRLAEDGRMTLRTTTIMVSRLMSLGASKNWIEHVKAVGGFSGAMDYRETADSLTATGANVVTHLIR